MISRRQFVSISGALLAATALPIPARVNAGAATSGPLGRPIGIQLYTVREQASADLAGTLAASSCQIGSPTNASPRLPRSVTAKLNSPECMNGPHTSSPAC